MSTTSKASRRSNRTAYKSERSPSPRRTIIVGGGDLQMERERPPPDINLPRAPSSVNTGATSTTSRPRSSYHPKPGSVAGSTKTGASRSTNGWDKNMALVPHPKFQPPPSEPESNDDYTVYLPTIAESTASHTPSNAPRKSSDGSDFTYTSKSHSNRDRPPISYRHVKAPRTISSSASDSRPPRSSSKTVVPRHDKDPQAMQAMENFMADFGRMDLGPTSSDRGVYYSRTRTTVTESHTIRKYKER